MKKIIVIIGIGLLLFLTILWQQITGVLPKPGQETARAAMEDGRVVFIENRNQCSYLYQIDKAGKMEKFLSIDTILPGVEWLDITTEKENIYIVGSKVSKEDRELYFLIKLDSLLTPKAIYECQEFQQQNFSHLSVNENNAYMVFLSPYRVEAMVYGLDFNQDNKIWQPILKRTAEEGRIYIEAVYQKGQLLASFDNGIGREYFKEPESIEITAGVPVYLSFLSKVIYQDFLYFLLYLALVGIPVLGILNQHSFALQVFSVMELLFIVVVLSGMAVCYFYIKKDREEERMACVRAYGSVLEEELGKYTDCLEKTDFYNTTEYITLQKTLAKYIRKNQNQEIFLDAAIVSLKENSAVFVASLTQYVNSNVKEKELVALLEEAKWQNQEVSGVYMQKGKKVGVFVVPDKNVVLAEYALVITVPFNSLSVYNKRTYNQILQWGIGLFFIGSILFIGINWLFSRSMQRLSETMKQEAKKLALQVEYGKLMACQAYSRFAPKQIEKLLGKNSIEEVKPGDYQTVTGALAMVCVEDKWQTLEEYRELLEIQIKCFERGWQEQKGILVDRDNGLNHMKILFPKEIQKALIFSIDVLCSWYIHMQKQEGTACILLHQTEVLYGVAGLEKEPVTYIMSPEIKELLGYAEKLKEHGVRLAVTKETVGLASNASMRYIGFLQLKQQEIKLYEILDVYAEKERKERVRHQELFQKAIELYYQNNFYLARNTFTEVVKSCPTDMVAKWYLFTCEKHLNQVYIGPVQYGLFA